ncbi:MAG: hypothetical protein A2Z47_04475 [Thermodesulfovibrio sp. RBG_19FT_COMBO_42_12]|nr:MAG: hypothetical protein A2Z47_04475 [Thermodesulfovibrio sp. RBG_19FT_COMBO_42_12]HZX48163.1 hypothetical protein [Nitrospirota bacterium]
MSLKGKKIACFLALPHHTRFFLPLRDEINKEGGELLFIIPLEEYPYELDLKKRGLSFRYFTDYMTEEVRDKINASTLELFDKWSQICFKWEGFSRWPLFKQTWLFNELVEEYYCMEEFIKVERPDMFIAHHECARWGKIIGHLCLKGKIPFVTFQEGDYYASTLGNAMHTEFSTADLLWGNVTKRRLAGYQCSVDKMFPIGNTHIDSALQEYADPEMITNIKKDLGLEPHKKVILFLVGIKYGGLHQRDIWQSLMQGFNSLDKETAFIFKWHPNVYKKTVDNIRETFKELYPSAMLLDTYDPYRLIAISDYCVTLGQTTLTIEAIAFGKPIFSIPDPDTTDDYYANMGVAQSVYPLGNWSSLFHTMKDGPPAVIQANVNHFLTDNFYRLDGKTVERAIGVMSYIMDVRGTTRKGATMRHKESVAGRVSFIIPSGNDAEALLATLTSLSQNVKYLDWEVIVVVNDESMHGILSGVSGDLKITGAEGPLANLYNTGADISSGEYLIFLRPGIIYFKDGGGLNVMKDGVTGIPIKNPDMTPYCLGIGFDYNGAPYKITDELIKAQAVGGGLLGVSRRILDSVGGFDEDVANHLIEPDICLKAKDLNVPIRYSPDGLAFNYKETFFGDDVTDEDWKNRIKFFAKWVGELPKDEDFMNFARNLLMV